MILASAVTAALLPSPLHTTRELKALLDKLQNPDRCLDPLRIKSHEASVVGPWVVLRALKHLKRPIANMAEMESKYLVDRHRQRMEEEEALSENIFRKRLTQRTISQSMMLVRLWRRSSRQPR